MLRKGFTLIELLIVITIIAILAGAAIPYVQDYIEDARLAKARADLGELRNAIIRYETERGKMFDPVAEGLTVQEFQKLLVGPYLQGALSDPWGSPYYFSHDASMVFSAAEDRDIDTNIIALDVRPPMAPVRAWWLDVDKDGSANAGDYIDVKFTRPIGAFGAIGDWVLSAGAWDTTLVPVVHPLKGDNWARFTLADTGTLEVKAGYDITVAVAVTDTAALNDAGFAAPPTAQGSLQTPVIIKAAQ
ncbi:MAG: hypothetical protein A2W80_13345 [Candidatus Riflebacteria bacterium GWC2_50_8]|nr:MAG: hypothetical protein A2W80_13345 [Candidatus Riflebacteria bacterium GWC2_50_8]